MSILGILPAVLLALVFLLLGYWVWQRKRWWALLPYSMGAMLLLYSLNIYGIANGHRQAFADYQQLLRLWDRPVVRTALLADPSEEQLYLASLTSQALYKTVQRFPAQREKAAALLEILADWVSDSGRFPAWRNPNRWAEQGFFLAHAGIILGHYQLMSKDETHAKRFRQCGEFLGQSLPTAKYKSIHSRPSEAFIRPADNAAALYTISLYDTYYAATLGQEALSDWLAYARRELAFEESRLPCSAFSSDDRCKLDGTASSLGMMIGYLGAAGHRDPQLYREWLHYFKQFGLSPISTSFQADMKNKAASRFCDIAAHPLSCENNLDAIAMWLAASYDGHYTYARILSKHSLSDQSTKERQFLNWRPQRKSQYLTELSIRVIAQMY